MQPTSLVYVGAYLLLMAPTYVLPYFGSNSSIINAVSAAAGWGMTPQWWGHAWALSLLSLLAWTRGAVARRNWLYVLPILATAFDLLPFLSMIPLVPTGLHLGAILCGVVGVVEPDESPPQSATNQRAKIGALTATGIALLGSAMFVVTAGRSVAKVAPSDYIPLPSEEKVSAPRAANPVPVAMPPVVSPSAPIAEPKPPVNSKPTVQPRHTTASPIQKKPESGSTTRYIKLTD